MHKEFPHSVILEHSYHEMDCCIHWCWRHFGPANGGCSDYASCSSPCYPLVLRALYNSSYEIADQGCWTTIWLGKIGYDYGFQEYYFKNESDMKAFVKACNCTTYASS